MEDKNFVKSWVPLGTESPKLSRDFWMPDQSCRVCYECDSHFTIFNRRHHCRLCGRVFCAKCTTNSIPPPSQHLIKNNNDDDKIRVCNYCFKQWEQDVTALADGTQAACSPSLSPSPSTTSLASIKSNANANSGSSSNGFSHTSSSVSPTQSSQIGSPFQDIMSPVLDTGHPSPNPFESGINRSDDYGDDYGASERRHFAHTECYYGPVQFGEIPYAFGSHENHPDEDVTETRELRKFSANDGLDSHELEGFKKHGHDCKAFSSVYGADDTDTDPVDFENNGLLWIPPEPEDEEDEREAGIVDDDEEDAIGEWSYLRSSCSFGSGEYCTKDRSGKENKKALKNVVDEHFRTLVSQLLQVENLPVGEEDHNESWLEIITSLSWEAATLLKPDTSESGGMDPGGYVKVKCLACGRPSESTVVKGVVCKKNVAHRRMTSKIVKPRFLILGGALEYQRVSNHLSSFDTLLQQEMDHLKMAVTKIDVHHPNVLLVEKSVSRFAQEYLLAKDISLVLNIKRPLLERISRCTGAQIVPSVDHLSSQKLGFCDLFHVEKFVEEHGSSGQGGKKLMKTLMFFEGCPKPLGYTILLKGAKGDDLKKVKHVVQYGVFAAYHLALETSFLVDEGASLPELPLKSPITVSLPDKTSNIGRSISAIPGFSISAATKIQGPHPFSELGKATRFLSSNSPMSNHNSFNTEPSIAVSPNLPTDPHPQYSGRVPNFNSASLSSPQKLGLHPLCYDLSSYAAYKQNSNEVFEESLRERASILDSDQDVVADHQVTNGFRVLEISSHEAKNNSTMRGLCEPNVSLLQDSSNFREEHRFSKEEFPPYPSDHQSILVSLSTRCVWKGTVCERAHLFRIKYYGSFDKPLGRFLREQLFDQSYRCRLCEMPSEAHIHCYTHRQGSLTISVKKLPEFLLPGEREGKIWMWHRCLRCPRTNGFPPATQRVVMSEAARGLSFGKFLELSFSNHAAASRVASCGHSLHRDCLRFYGSGRMVACFRYASINVHSVYLPPPKLEFNYEAQDWIQREANEVMNKVGVLFNEVLNALFQISDKNCEMGSFDSYMKVTESKLCIEQLEGMLQKEKEEFEVSLQKALNKEITKGQPSIDILEINRIRRQLIFHSYVWDHRLVYAASVYNSSLQKGMSSSISKSTEKAHSYFEKTIGINSTSKQITGFTSCDSLSTDTKFGGNVGGLGQCFNQPGFVHYEKKTDELPHGEEVQPYLSTPTPKNIADPSDLTSGTDVCRDFSEGQFPILTNLSDTLDAAWTGKNHSGTTEQKEGDSPLCDFALSDRVSAEEITITSSKLEELSEYQGTSEVVQSLGPASTVKTAESIESRTWGIPLSWVATPLLNSYCSLNRISSGNTPEIDTLREYNPVYISSFRDLEHQGGGRLLLPLGVNDAVVPVYDDEPSSIISYALVSPDYRVQISEELDRPTDGGESSVSFPSSDLMNLHSLHSLDETASGRFKSFNSTDDSILSASGSRSNLSLDPLLYTKALHARVSFADDGPLGKVKYTVTCYCARSFETLRRICCPSELDFIRSLSRCKKWKAQGGKSNAFFAKSLDDRFIIKQVTKTELESFIMFAPAYFKYISESIISGSSMCLAKILGIYQVTSKHLKGGKDLKMDVLVMENLLFQRKVTRVYDLKGSSRSRYNADSSGSNKVLLDQNLIEAMPTSPIFVGNKAKRLLERAVWNDTSFLATIDVMDYSLLVGVDEEKHELVVGIIDYMRQYTWDKHLETWVKASGILGGPKNASPTIISPKEYKKRFRKAMSSYFIMVPDQWSPLTIIPTGSQPDLCSEGLPIN